MPASEELSKESDLIPNWVFVFRVQRIGDQTLIQDCLHNL
jgi:hypothetical protein